MPGTNLETAKVQQTIEPRTFKAAVCLKKGIFALQSNNPSMKIGSLEFGKYPLLLAPMEDVTDPAFRLICKRFGADMVYTEFVSSDALVRNVNKTQQKLHISEKERPVAIQIYGRFPEAMAEAAKLCEEAKPDIIDINFGCPVKKVAGKGAGAGMLRDVPKMLEITKRVVEAVGIPVTVKTRLGWDDSSKIIVELAEALQDCGIAALAIHGRTRAQMYTGEADWSLIGAVKNNPRMRIPIIGNGDVNTPQIARQRFDETGVDAVMIGRASIGRPWIFEEVKHYLSTGNVVESISANNGEKEKNAPYSFNWKIQIIKQQIEDSVRRTDERRGIIHIRRHLAATPVFKGIPNFRETRIALLRAETVADLFRIIDSIEENPFGQ
jgi:tRNA-dihydrouridine synthase B